MKRFLLATILELGETVLALIIVGVIVGSGLAIDHYFGSGAMWVVASTIVCACVFGSLIYDRMQRLEREERSRKNRRRDEP